MALATVIWSASMCHPYSQPCTPSPAMAAMDTFARPFSIKVCSARGTGKDMSNKHARGQH